MSHDRLVPLIIAVALFMENMDSTIIATSLPAIAADIGANPLELKLALTDPSVSLIPNSVMWLAKDLGYYQREGLDVDLLELTGTPLAIAALVSGQADVANIGVPEAFSAMHHGQDDRA